MEAITYFERRLPGSDWGRPTDRDSTGCDVRVFTYNGAIHIEMRPAAAGGDPDHGPDRRYVALIEAEDLRAMLDALQFARSQISR